MHITAECDTFKNKKMLKTDKVIIIIINNSRQWSCIQYAQLVRSFF